MLGASHTNTPLKENFCILLLFGLSISAIAQTNNKVKEIFYNLPLDASNKEISKKLRSDIRFRSTKNIPDSILYFFEPTFLGICSDNGLVKSKPDSIEVELTWGYFFSPEFKKAKHKFTGDLFLKSRYYYSSSDSVEREYRNMLAILSVLTHDTLSVGIDTVYSESPIRSKLKAHGVEFIFHKPYYKVQVLFANITEDYFGLFLEYARKEK